MLIGAVYRACASADNSLLRFVNSPFVLERPGVAAAYIYNAVEGVIFIALTLLLEVCACNFVYIHESVISWNYLNTTYY